MIRQMLFGKGMGSAVAAIAAMAFLFVTSLEATEPAAAADHKVEIKGFKFSPATLKVRVGDRITFVNRDIVPHTATAKDKSWDTKNLSRGKSAVVVVKAGMKADYFCRFHPQMKGRLEIVQ